MAEQKQLVEMSDLEVAELQGQQYQLFMQTQNNLMIISKEIETRKTKIQPKE